VSRRAFLLGGSGQTGRALVPRLLERGWEVVVASRGQTALPGGVEHVAVDRGDDEALRQALGSGVDVLVDFIAFEPEHAEQLLSVRDLVRSVVVVSSAAVYFEADGPRPEPPEAAAFPRLPVPLTEGSPTAPPGPATYATKKAAIERTLLAQDDLPATLLRSGAIHGPGSSYAREWHFVKRVLDSRRAIVLAWRGKSRFHPISVRNLAELIWLASERPGRRVLNAGDPTPPTVLEISRLVAAHLGHEWAEVLIDDAPGELGKTPWSVPHDCVLDMTEAEFELGYRPVTTYAKALPETIEWLVEATRERPWQELMPRAAQYMKDEFDYGAEDELLRRLTGC
jgi:nucleoside-diphosphate-sugar epimerase